MTSNQQWRQYNNSRTTRQQQRARDIEKWRHPYFRVLGVDQQASRDDIKKAYLRLALQHHPDRNKGCKLSEQHFRKVQEAYNVLYKQHYQVATGAHATASPAAPPGTFYRPRGFSSYGAVDEAKASSEENFTQFVRALSVFSLLLSVYYYQKYDQRFQSYLAQQRLQQGRAATRRRRHYRYFREQPREQ